MNVRTGQSGRKGGRGGRGRKGGKKDGAYLRYRISFVFGLCILLFVVIAAKAFQLQLLEGDELKRRAMGQHKTTILVESKRGDIYDRNLKDLAVSMEVDSVYAQPANIASPGRAARTLSKALGLNQRKVEKVLRADKKFVWIKRQVDLKDGQRELVSGVEGVGIVKESRRFYPNRQLASNLLGFTGVDSVGLEGVELYYDDYLRGQTRRVVGNRDAKGRFLIFDDTDKKVPVQGLEVELTIDKTIQYIAEKVLNKAVDGFGAKGGMAVVMDPATGEVLALANSPTFDPNDFARFGPGQWRNKAVTDTFEPGSVSKAFLVAAALEEGIVGPHDIFFCENGRYRVADRVFHDTSEHAWLSVAQIVKYSSNIGSAKVGEKLGRARLYRYLKSFGFGTRTGIDLPGEASGSLSHYSRWSDVKLHTVSFGQGVSATGIQLVSAISAVANGGFLMKPYIVRALKDPGGKVVKETNPVIIRRVISEETSRTVTGILTGVTGKGGTGMRASLPGFEVAGKTATAQKPDLKNGGYMKDAFTASFLGYVPASDPKLAILVMIDEPKGDDYHGGTVAAPVFREIAAQSLSYMGIFPENTQKDDRSRPSFRLASTSAAELKPVYRGVNGAELEDGSIPDFRGKTMRTVLRMAQARSIDVQIKGSGVAVSQKPAPGGSVPKNGRAEVWFQ